MSRVEVNQVVMNKGMALIIKGIPNQSPESFRIGVGESQENIALYCNVSFAEKKVILNSKKNGQFGQAMTVSRFPFKENVEFKMTITFQGDFFDVALTDCYMAKFDSPLSDLKSNRSWVEGDVLISGISLM